LPNIKEGKMRKLLLVLLLITIPLMAWGQPSMIGPGAGGMIGGVPGTVPNLSLSVPRITPGSGTGVSIVDAGSLRTQLYKITVLYSNLITAGVTHDLTIATLPAKTIVHSMIANVTTPFVCAATCTTATLSATIGSAAGGTQYLASFDIDAAAAVFGDANAEVGASMDAAGFTNGGYSPNFASTSVVSVRFTSGTGNLGNGTVTNLNAGSVTFYIIASVLP
jgi:hypothetical protein